MATILNVVDFFSPPTTLLLLYMGFSKARWDDKGETEKSTFFTTQMIYATAALSGKFWIWQTIIIIIFHEHHTQQLCLRGEPF